MSIFSALFGQKINFKEAIENGAIIIDVRTPGEFSQGHIKGSKNIPLQSLPSQMNKLSKEKIIITCCASGMRSGSAKSLLSSNGFKVVYNGGSWKSLQEKI